MAEKTALIAEKMATNWKAKIGHIVSVGMNPIKLNFEPKKTQMNTKLKQSNIQVRTSL